MKSTLFGLAGTAVLGFFLGFTFGRAKPNTPIPMTTQTIITITNLPPGVSNIIIYPAGPGGGAGR